MVVIGEHTDVAVYGTLDVINALTGKTGEKVKTLTKVVTSETLATSFSPTCRTMCGSWARSALAGRAEEAGH